MSVPAADRVAFVGTAGVAAHRKADAWASDVGPTDRSPADLSVAGLSDADLSDADLSATVSAARDGCRDAFDDLVRATYDDTFSLALRLTGDPHDASDVAQDTYLRALRGLSRFRGDAHIATWLYRITSNSAATLRSRRRRHGHEELGTDAALAEFAPDNDPSLQADATDLRERLARAIDRLPPKLRDVVILRDVRDLTHEQIAVELQITESAAKVRLHRARERLRAELFDEDGLVAQRPGSAELIESPPSRDRAPAAG